MTEDAALAHVGQIIADKYRLLSLLGAGGMGAVYEAEHVFTKRRVALKRMHSGTAKSKLAAERFLRESQAPSSIGHPGIVQVLDGGRESDGSLYLVLELLEGVSLREALDENALQAEQVVQIGIELLEALASAHDKGFIHRDVKPDNIFLAHDGREGVTVKLLDFGVASVRDNEADVRLTQTGAVLGTPLYMSPEQATGHRIDARSDLWAVGALLYRALSGASPFDGDSYNALIVSIVTQDHVPLSARRGDLPAALLEVVERALQKRLDRRFQSAGEMLDALRSVRFDPHAARQPRVSRPAQPTRPHQIAAAANPVPAPPQTLARPRGRPMWILWVLAGGLLVPALFAMQRLERHHPQDRGAGVAEPGPAAMPAQPPPSAAAPEPQPHPERTGLQPVAADVNTPVTLAAGDLPRPPAVGAGLRVEQITSVLAAQQPHMQACLQDAVVAQMLAGAPTTQPLHLMIELHIAPNGRADSVRAVGAVPAELEQCVRGRLREAVFDPAPVATEFRYPLIFESTIIGR